MRGFNMKVLRTFTWNGQDYTVIEMPDGERREFSLPEDKALLAAEGAVAREAEEKGKPTDVSLKSSSDEELRAECVRRKLVVVIAGEVI
jgi:hypothetical protein